MIWQAFETFPSSAASCSNDSFLRVLCGRAVIGSPPGSWVFSDFQSTPEGPGARLTHEKRNKHQRLSDNYRTISRRCCRRRSAATGRLERRSFPSKSSHRDLRLSVARGSPVSAIPPTSLCGPALPSPPASTRSSVRGGASPPTIRRPDRGGQRDGYGLPRDGGRVSAAQLWRGRPRTTGSR